MAHDLSGTDMFRIHNIIDKPHEFGVFESSEHRSDNMIIKTHQMDDSHHHNSISTFDVPHTASADFRDREDQLFEEDSAEETGSDDNNEMEIYMIGPTHTDKHALYPAEIWGSIEADEADIGTEKEEDRGVVVGAADLSTNCFSPSFELQTPTHYPASLHDTSGLVDSSGYYQQRLHELTARIEYLPESPRFCEIFDRDSPANTAQSPAFRMTSDSLEYLPVSPRFEPASPSSFGGSKSPSPLYRGFSESPAYTPATPEYLPISPKYAQSSLASPQHRDLAASPDFMPESPKYARVSPGSIAPPQTREAEAAGQYIPPLDQWYGREKWPQQFEERSERWAMFRYDEMEMGRIEREDRLDAMDVANEALASPKWSRPNAFGLKDENSVKTLSIELPLVQYALHPSVYQH